MRPSHHERRPRQAGVTLVLAVFFALASAACGGGAGDAADRERTGAADMGSVTFTDVARELGLDFRHGAFRWSTAGDPAAMMGGGLCWIDVDRDGRLDLFVTNTWSEGEWSEWQRDEGLPTTHLFRNAGGRFVDVTNETGAGREIRGNGCVAADLDLDGWTDLYITSDRTNQLLWNDGGVFVEGAAAAGVAASGWQTGAAVGDVDGDGWPDLFVAGYADVNRTIPDATKGFPNTFEPEPDLLYLNRGPEPSGRVRFTEAAMAAGVERGGFDYGLGVLLTDVDRDGDLDVYVANDTNPNRLYVNEAPASSGGWLADNGAAAGVGDDNAGMGVAAGDFDSNGDVDLVVTNMGDQGHMIFRADDSAADPRYLDALAEMGRSDLGRGRTGWGTTWIDADLDTDLDLVIAHGAIPVRDLVADRELVALLEFRPGADGGDFVDATATVGLDGVGPYLGRGLAAADYDNDGDLDLAVGTIGGPLGLLRNAGAGGHWLGVEVDPATPGTVVTVSLPDGTQQQREVRAGGSYLSSEDPRALFGLGSATGVARVEVAWPDGTSTVHEDVGIDRYLAIASE